MEHLDDNCLLAEVEQALDLVVLSYGGDLNDNRTRLDPLIEGKPKYW